MKLNEDVTKMGGKTYNYLHIGMSTPNPGGGGGGGHCHWRLYQMREKKKRGIV